MNFKFISASKKANIEGALLLKDNANLYIEEKFDGSRFGLELDKMGIWHAWSRNSIDRAKNIPYIIEQLDQLDVFPVGTVLDCEVIVMFPDRTKRWELSRSVMGTKEYDTTAKQAHLLIFDIQRYGDIDYKSKGYLKRRLLINRLFAKVEMVKHDTYKSFGNIAYTRSWKINHLEELWELIVEKGNGEGVMLKNSATNNLGKDWTKVKKEATCDAFILGATTGRGKYEGQIGALELAVCDASGTIWPIGKCSGMEDSVRRKMTDLAIAKQLKHLVVEVKFNDVTKNKKLRHPRFIRWRKDKAKEECLLEQL